MRLETNEREILLCCKMRFHDTSLHELVFFFVTPVKPRSSSTSVECWEKTIRREPCTELCCFGHFVLFYSVVVLVSCTSLVRHDMQTEYGWSPTGGKSGSGKGVPKDPLDRLSQYTDPDHGGGGNSCRRHRWELSSPWEYWKPD